MYIDPGYICIDEESYFPTPRQWRKANKLENIAADVTIHCGNKQTDASGASWNEDFNRFLLLSKKLPKVSDILKGEDMGADQIIYMLKQRLAEKHDKMHDVENRKFNKQARDKLDKKYIGKTTKLVRSPDGTLRYNPPLIAAYDREMNKLREKRTIPNIAKYTAIKREIENIEIMIQLGDSTAAEMVRALLDKIEKL